MNNRPVALTPVVMKCLERIILDRLLPVVSPIMDKLQFAYCKNRSVEGATITVLNHIYHHLDKPGACARARFVDFISAYNTILPDILTEKLKNYGVPIFVWLNFGLLNQEKATCVCNQSWGHCLFQDTCHQHWCSSGMCPVSSFVYTVY